jgi:hypothetical protein
MRLEGIGKLKKIHLIGTRTRDLPACSIVPQTTTLPHAVVMYQSLLKLTLGTAASSVCQSQSQSQIYFTTGGLPPNQFFFATSPLRLMTRSFFQLNTGSHNPYVASSLTRGWICRLQLLLVSPAQSFSGLSPAGFMIIFYCLRFETPPIWRSKSPYLYPP